MSKKQFKPTPSLRQEHIKKRNTELQSKMQRQRAKFEQNQNRPYSVRCISPRLSLSIRPVRALITYFVVTLKKPLPKEEIQIRMVKGFGDLEEHKETIEKAI